MLAEGLSWEIAVHPRGHGAHLRHLVELLRRPRSATCCTPHERSFGFGYGAIGLFGAIVAVGTEPAWRHLLPRHHSGRLPDRDGADRHHCRSLFRRRALRRLPLLHPLLDGFRLVLLALTAVVLVVPVLMAQADVGWCECLLVLSLAPWVTVRGLRTVGYHYNMEVLASLED